MTEREQIERETAEESIKTLLRCAIEVDRLATIRKIDDKRKHGIFMALAKVAGEIGALYFDVGEALELFDKAMEEYEKGKAGK